MKNLKNMAGLTQYDINLELSKGARFVVFQYCFSMLIMTFKRNSSIYFIKSGESTIKHSFRFILLTLLLGWWGLPWGPIHSIGSIYTNLRGGKDVTAEVLTAVNEAA